jgi:glucosamine-6-phosphate deaminase
VIWLARQLDKPILKLTDEDYNEHTLQELLAENGPASRINVDVFRAIQERITGWPGGKPDAKKRPGDIRRKSDTIYPKRCLIFSPHPDDDVISMGGTLIRLIDQGHDVHVAYQTSGNIAVFDGDALRFVDFALDFNRLFQISPQQSESRAGGQPRGAADQGVDSSGGSEGSQPIVRRPHAESVFPGSAVL